MFQQTLFRVLAATVAVLAIGEASAKTCTWIKGNGDWGDSANWQDGVVPEAGDDVVFSIQGSAKGGTINLQESATAELASLSFEDASGWNIQGGTLLLQRGTVVVSNAVTVKLGAVVASDGDVDLTKRGNGTLSLSGANTFTGRIVLEDGRLQPETVDALGPAPAEYKADAIILKGGVMGCSETPGVTNVIVATRGITLVGAGELEPRSDNTLLVEAPIVGDGELRISRQSGRVRLAAVNSYTGRTLLASVETSYISGGRTEVHLDVDGALPPTTKVLAYSTAYMDVTTSLYLNGTTQRVTDIEVSPRSRCIVYGDGGTLRFGTDGDAHVALTNFYLSTGGTLAYAGAGTVAPSMTTAEGTTFALESGTLALTAGKGINLSTLALSEGTAVVADAGVACLSNDVVLAGRATLTAAESPFTLLGHLTRAAEDATLAVGGAARVVFGADDTVCRTLGAPVVAAEGTTFTLDGWVEATVDPTDYDKTANCIIFGDYAGVVPGDLALDGQILGVRDVAQLGEAASLSLANGSRLVFCSDETSAAPYAIDVDATSVVEFGGTGVFDLSQASLTGAGTVRIAGATVALKGDLTGQVLAGVAGDVYVEDGETLAVGVVTGTLRKTGAGTLIVTGNVANSCRIEIEAGTVRLAATGTATGNVVVRDGGTLVLDADDQIRDDCNVFLEGVFDLNGHHECIQRYYNTPGRPADTFRSAWTGALVNRSQQKATLECTGETAFYGRITEESGAIELVQSNGMMDPFGPPGSAAPSKVSATNMANIFPYTRWNRIRFVFHEMQQPDLPLQLSEIQLTYQGRPILSSSLNGGETSGAASGTVMGNLSDDRADTYWQAADVGECYVSFSLRDYPAVDGYRLGARSLPNSPRNWDVYVWRTDPSGWMLVDSRRDVRIVRRDPTWSTFSNTMSTNFLFSAPQRPNSPFAATTAVDLQGTSSAIMMRVCSTDPMRVGAVSGTGLIRIENGSAFAPGDLTDWMGAFTFQDPGGYDRQSRIQLSSERGGAAAQPVRVTADNANVAIENEGTEPVSVLIDDNFPESPLRGRLADGNGPLGLVKRGAGTRTLGTANCANTGVTSVEEGCLKVCGTRAGLASVTARYIRIWPTKNNKGNDSNGYNWGMNDFQILDADGTRIAFPSGTTVTGENGLHSSATGANLIDGNIGTRCLVWNTEAEKSAKKGYCSWVTIDMKTPVSFAGYRWYTPHNNAADQSRVPIAWTLSVSDDGANWTVVDTVSDPYTLEYGSGNNGFLRGPYTTFHGENDGVQTLATIPDVFFAGATARSTRAPALKARYFRFKPLETYNPTASSNSYGWMISEFSLFLGEERVDWPTNARPSMAGGGLSDTNGSSLSNFCDNETSGSSEQANLERVFVMQMPSYVTVDAGEEVTFDGYGFYSAGGGCRDDRVPTAWTFEVSTNGTDWCVVDSRCGERDIVKGDYCLQGIWRVGDKFPLLGASTATDAIGDASPVVIASGATLAVNSDYERVGALSGTGALELVSDSTVELNATVNGSFAGTVGGAGTLAVCGVATQNFENAALTGVKTFELNGGTVTGAASFGNRDVTLACNGGELWGTLSDIAMLRTSGTPVIRIPADAKAQGGASMVLVQAANIATAAQEAFAHATVIEPADAGSWRARVSTSATQVKVVFGPVSTLIVIR